MPRRNRVCYFSLARARFCQLISRTTIRSILVKKDNYMIMLQITASLHVLRSFLECLSPAEVSFRPLVQAAGLLSPGDLDPNLRSSRKLAFQEQETLQGLRGFMRRILFWMSRTK